MIRNQFIDGNRNCLCLLYDDETKKITINIMGLTNPHEIDNPYDVITTLEDAVIFERKRTVDSEMWLERFNGTVRVHLGRHYVVLDRMGIDVLIEALASVAYWRDKHVI